MRRKKELFQKGFSYVVMSGSGSTFFCLGKIVKEKNEDMQLLPFFSVNRSNKKWYHKSQKQEQDKRSIFLKEVKA